VRAVNINHAPTVRGRGERAYFVHTVRTGQLLLLDLLRGRRTLKRTRSWLNMVPVGTLVTEYERDIKSLNVLQNCPASQAEGGRTGAPRKALAMPSARGT